ncbi:hypothetical protein J0H58_37760 [bacterium]|nr:hypothetical protein [bacterium]
MAKPKWLTLCWNGRELGRINNVGAFDPPWMCGWLVPGDWPSDLRSSIETLARAVATESDLPDPPPGSGYYDGWSVVDPAGVVSEIGVPVVDFATGDIQWR